MASKVQNIKRTSKTIENALDLVTSETKGEETSQTAPVSAADRLQKLKELRKRMDESANANRQEVYAEHQRSKTNPKFEAKLEKKTLEAERLRARLEAQERGEDYERTRCWGYNAEAAEKWEAKEEERKKRSEIGFTDFNQVAEKKYKKNINKLKPNLGTYEAQKKVYEVSLASEPSSELAVASEVATDGRTVRFNAIHPKPSAEAVDRLVKHVKDEISERAKFSKIRPVKEEDDITYINDRNAHFNRKISRAFDKYTKEIRDNFERGTAL